MEPHIGGARLRENEVAMDAMRAADMVIDLVGLHLLRGGELPHIRAADTRILYVTEPPEALARMMPSEDDKRRVYAAGRRIEAARTMRVESDAGTNFTCELGEYPVLYEYGYADDPGHWDHWPAGFVATWPNERSARGTIVVDRGDIVFPFKSYVQTPIRVDFEDGFVTGISGDFDAAYMREFIESYNDRDGFAMSHVGWGLQPRASWTALGMMDKAQTNGNDGRAFYGNFMFSTGPNDDAGGPRDTLCHLDIPMRHCSVWLDDEPMVLKGEVIPDDQRAPGGETARPPLRRAYFLVVAPGLAGEFDGREPEAERDDEHQIALGDGIDAGRHDVALDMAPGRDRRVIGARHQRRDDQERTPAVENRLGAGAEHLDQHVDADMALGLAHQPRHAEERGEQQEILADLDHPADRRAEEIAQQHVDDHEHHRRQHHHPDDRGEQAEETIVCGDRVHETCAFTPVRGSG